MTVLECVFYVLGNLCLDQYIQIL